jgi:hypothetical protein
LISVNYPLWNLTMLVSKQLWIQHRSATWLWVALTTNELVKWSAQNIQYASNSSGPADSAIMKYSGKIKRIRICYTSLIHRKSKILNAWDVDKFKRNKGHVRSVKKSLQNITVIYAVFTLTSQTSIKYFTVTNAMFA